ncbi:hypothetical protein PYCC9005_004370 [Savitreella phatthalungensis]
MSDNQTSSSSGAASTGSKKRAPRGLAAAAKAKRAKLDGSVANEPSSVEKINEASLSRTIALEGDFEEGEDEIGELIALYSQAVTQLQSSQPQLAIAVLNGTIHEADRILRNRETKEDGTAAVQLPNNFYATYASALLDLSTTADESDKSGSGERDYIEAALERVEAGLDNGDSKSPGSAELKLVQAKCLARKGEFLLKQEHQQAEDVDSAGQIHELLGERLPKLLKEHFKARHYTPVNLYRTLCTLQKYADTFGRGDAAKTRPEFETLNRQCESHWTAVLAKDGTNVSALHGCATVWLSIANEHLDRVEADVDGQDQDDESAADAGNSDERDTAVQALQTAIELLDQALKTHDAVTLKHSASRAEDTAEGSQGSSTEDVVETGLKGNYVPLGDILALLIEALFSLSSATSDSAEEHLARAKELVQRAAALSDHDRTDTLERLLDNLDGSEVGDVEEEGAEDGEEDADTA